MPGTENFAVAQRIPLGTTSPDATTRDLTIPLPMLCNADRQARIKFATSSMKAGSNKQFASVETSLEELEGGRSEFSSGDTSVSVSNFSVFVKPTFVDYLRSGWAVSLVAAIDYTASNGNPSDRRSLHYLGATNQYEKALMNVGSVVEPYDSDRSFPVFGFGGIPRHMGHNEVSHCFAMNGNASNPEIIGIAGIVSTYRQTLKDIGLGGPTLFAPLL